MGHSHEHHGHQHHHHGPAERSSSGHGARSALAITLALNAGFLVVEVVVALWSGSLALLSDAAHMLSDVGALILALGAAQLATLAASPDRSYGWRRAEVLGGFLNGVTLLAACAWIFKEAIERLLEGGAPMLAGPALLAAVLGLFVNLGSAWVLHRANDGGLNMRGALAHMLADALGSVGAIVAAALAFYGVMWADAAISLFIGVMVLRGTWGLLRESTSVLLQFAPATLPADEIERSMRAVDGVRGVHELHLWSLDGQRAVLSAHLVAAPGASALDVRSAVERTLHQRYGELHTTLQVEPPDSPCEHGGCSLAVGQNTRT